MKSIFSKHWRGEKPPKIDKTRRPIDGKVLLTLFKDRYTLAHFCNALEVEFNTDIAGYPLKSTTDAIIEALIHQLIGSQTGNKNLLAQLESEMEHNLYCITTKEQWEQFKLLEPEERWR